MKIESSLEERKMNSQNHFYIRPTDHPLWVLCPHMFWIIALLYDILSFVSSWMGRQCVWPWTQCLHIQLIHCWSMFLEPETGLSFIHSPCTYLPSKPAVQNYYSPESVRLLKFLVPVLDGMIFSVHRLQVFSALSEKISLFYPPAHYIFKSKTRGHSPFYFSFPMSKDPFHGKFLKHILKHFSLEH